MGLVDPAATLSESSPSGKVLLIEDRPDASNLFGSTLGQAHTLVHIERFEEALAQARAGDFGLIIVSLSLRGFDGLRLCSQLRSLPEVRNVPILVLVSEADKRKLNQALEMGVNDYLTRPVDRNELVARVRTQLRKKRYADKLRQNVHMSVELAMTDQLTGLHNRHYMTRHLDTLLSGLATSRKPLAFLVIDVDHFKRVNDTYGHDVGDEILREFARRIGANIRGHDLACRFGGEEFVVIMPDTDVAMAYPVAERLRASVECTPFPIRSAPGELGITVSIGVAGAVGTHDTADALLRRADQALYRAKHTGRNRVVADAA
jgi:two-component system cell cycle response regulator